MSTLASVPGVWHVAALRRRIVRAVRRRSAHGVVLLYHRVAGPRRDPQWLDVNPELFDAQLAVIARIATPLALDDFERRRRSGRLPARAVAITFDDGYADNLHAAAPLLARHAIPATVFVTAGMVGSDREFWWDDAERIAFARTLPDWPPTGLAIPWNAGDSASAPSSDVADRWTVASPQNPSPRHRLYRALATALHPLATSPRDARLAEWRAWAGVPAAGRTTHRAVTEEELRALATSPGISVGAHTVTHPSLAHIPPADQAREMTEARSWLERALGVSVGAAAYPFGTAGDVSGATVRAASTICDYAMANEPGAAWRWSSRWRLPRVLVRDWEADVFERHLTTWLEDR
jgi:peptidoglycan/xylan/chitin deacetylase (PgdA/CDA1 family)